MICRARLVQIIAIMLLLGTEALGQTPPGPTAPKTPLPVPKKGEDLVVNPTLDECKAGWHAGLKWSKEDFDKLCTQLRISK